MMQIWETHKKFILIVGGAAAVLLMFLWYSLSALDAAAMTRQGNSDKNARLLERRDILLREEDTNKSKFVLLDSEVKKRMLKSIECNEDLPDFDAGGSATVFFGSLVDRYTSKLLARDPGADTKMPYHNPRRSKWVMWGLPRLKSHTPPALVTELRRRIYMTNNIFNIALNSGVGELTGLRQIKIYDVKIKGAREVLRRTPVKFTVRGSYQSILKLIGDLQRDEKYLQLIGASIDNKKAKKDQVQAIIEVAALNFEKPKKSSTGRGTGRHGPRGRRDRDY